MSSPKVVQQGSVGLAGAIEGDPAFVSSGNASAASYQGPSVDPALTAQYGFDPSGLSGEPSTPSTWRLNSIENYVRYDVASLIEGYRTSGSTTPISTVVLGCTHFPFQRDQIAAAFERLRAFRDAGGAQPYEGIISPHVELVDPAKLTAKQLWVSLAAKSRFADPSKPRVLDENAFFISKPNPTLPEVKLTAEGTLDSAYKYGRSAGHFDRETVKRVPMRATDLTPPLLTLMQRSMPAVWESFQKYQSSRWVSGR
jgi:hypothetical protein